MEEVEDEGVDAAVIGDVMLDGGADVEDTEVEMPLKVTEASDW